MNQRYAYERPKATSSVFGLAVGLSSALLFAAGCGIDTDSTEGFASPPSNPLAGLYQPGNVYGADPNSDGGIAVTPREIADALIRQSGGMNLCGALADDIGLTKDDGDRAIVAGTAKTRPRTPCTLKVSFTTVPQAKRWTPKNVGAVWISDPQNRYVRTLEVWAAERVTSLGLYVNKTCRLPDADVVTGATLVDHSIPHTKDTWNCKDVMGNVVPDGTYSVFIEVAETETEYGATSTITFPKGTAPVHMVVPMSPPTVAATAEVTIDYAPGVDAPAGPSTGP